MMLLLVFSIYLMMYLSFVRGILRVNFARGVFLSAYT